jgi:hypothetical protein
LQCHSKVNGRSACTSFAKNGKVLTARISVDELRLSFMLEEKYNRYALLNERAAGCKTRTKRTL